MKQRMMGWILACLLGIFVIGCNGMPLQDLNTGTGMEITSIGLDNIPEYAGEAVVEVNQNIPYFTEDELKETDISLSSLDDLGRCGMAMMSVSLDTMPKKGEKRGEIGMVKPAGWHTVKYDCIEERYLYNRCHLLGWQLSGLNKEERNLITGTRYMNVQGMLPYENQIADYVEDTGNSVIYRVTPIYKGQEKVARGVLMEAQSLEETGFYFCVYAYNVQPGVAIDYKTGESSEQNQPEATKDNGQASAALKYIVNTNTEKFHKITCTVVEDMSEKNKKELAESREELIRQGYSPCKICCP